jgi:hypothetical protein
MNKFRTQVDNFVLVSSPRGKIAEEKGKNVDIPENHMRVAFVPSDGTGEIAEINHR